MKEGTPVTWLFMIFILVVYAGGYIWNQEIENDRLLKQIELLQEENEQLHTLVDAMFQYMNMYPNSVIPEEKFAPGFDPIHRSNNKPL